MARDDSRRSFLRIAGASTLATLAGCASAIDSVSNADENDSTSETTTAWQTTEETTQSETTNGTDESSNSTEGTTTEQWSTDDLTIKDPPITFEDVPIPKKKTDRTYALMGRSDVNATVTLYGNWKCPYTREFVNKQFPDIVDEYVRSGDLAVEFRSLAYVGGKPFLGPDSPRASRAGLAVWHADPQSYWTYFIYVFGNQPAEKHEWAKPKLLTRFAKAAGVKNPADVRETITSGKFEGPVKKTTKAADELPIGTVPRIAFDGEVTAPTVNPKKTREQLDDAAGR